MEERNRQSGRRAWRDRFEFWLLGGVFLAGLLFLVLGRIVAGNSGGGVNGFDVSVLTALRDGTDPAVPLGPYWLAEAARDVTALGSLAILGLVTIASVIYLLLIKRAGAALLVSVAVLGGQGLSVALKAAIARPRPDLTGQAVEFLSPSFPSGHAMLSAVTYLTLGALLAGAHEEPRIKAYLIGLAVFVTLAVGSTRVYLGAHYPTDVLAGWCFGAAWAALCLAAFRWLQERDLVKPAIHDKIDEGDRANG